jgi:diketogulonate reductase-like aldo/keto reductase
LVPEPSIIYISISVLHRIAAERSVSAHSIAFRFFNQSGSGVIPRSTNKDHLEENLDSFDYELSDSEMSELGWPDRFLLKRDGADCSSGHDLFFGCDALHMRMRK